MDNTLTDDILKVTALLYFTEALQQQQFEDCKALILAAKELGAEQAEIQEVIAAYLRGDQGGGNREAHRVKNRLRSIKEKK